MAFQVLTRYFSLNAFPALFTGPVNDDFFAYLPKNERVLNSLLEGRENVDQRHVSSTVSEVTFKQNERHEIDFEEFDSGSNGEDTSETFEFVSIVENITFRSNNFSVGDNGDGIHASASFNVGDGGRPPPDTPPDPEPVAAEDTDPDPAPPPTVQPEDPERPTGGGRPEGATPGPSEDTAPSDPPGDENGDFGRPDDATPDLPPDTGPVTVFTSGGPASTSYNITIEFEGTWSTQLQQAFTGAADYLSSIILADVPDAVVDGVAIDDISITATLEGIDGVGGVLGSAGPRELRGDGTFLPSTGAMTFDSEDAANQLGLGNWESIVLHEMMHALGFGTLWSLMGLVSGTVAAGDIRFTGANATDVYQSEFPGIAGEDPGSFLGVPVEADGGPGTAGGHWDEFLFQDEVMTGYVDTGSFVSEMTIAALEDMGYDTVFDNPYSASDQFGPIPSDPLLDIFG